MIFTSISFRKIEQENKLGKFTGYTNEQLNTLIDTTLETNNIVIFLFNIVKIIAKVNKVVIDTSSLEVRKLLLKVNISQNRENLYFVLRNLDAYNEEIRELNEIIDKSLLHNFDKKMDMLEALEPLCRVAYPHFDDLLILNRLEIENPFEEEEIQMQKNLDQKEKDTANDEQLPPSDAVYILIGVVSAIGVLSYVFLFHNK